MCATVLVMNEVDEDGIIYALLLTFIHTLYRKQPLSIVASKRAKIHQPFQSIHQSYNPPHPLRKTKTPTSIPSIANSASLFSTPTSTSCISSIGIRCAPDPMPSPSLPVPLPVLAPFLACRKYLDTAARTRTFSCLHHQSAQTFLSNCTLCGSAYTKLNVPPCLAGACSRARTWRELPLSSEHNAPAFVFIVEKSSRRSTAGMRPRDSLKSALNPLTTTMERSKGSRTGPRYFSVKVWAPARVG